MRCGRETREMLWRMLVARVARKWTGPRSSHRENRSVPRKRALPLGAGPSRAGRAGARRALPTAAAEVLFDPHHQPVTLPFLQTFSEAAETQSAGKCVRPHTHRGTCRHLSRSLGQVPARRWRSPAWKVSVAAASCPVRMPRAELRSSKVRCELGSAKFQ